MAGQFDWLYAHQPGPPEMAVDPRSRQMSYAETFAALDAAMARLLQQQQKGTVTP